MLSSSLNCLSIRKDYLGADEAVSNLFIAVFTIGVAAGALLNNRLLRGRVTARYVPLAGLGISLFGIDFALANGFELASTANGLIGIGAFLGELRSWRVVFDLFALAVCGGLFSVPLYALIQHLSDPKEVSRNIAANNVLNAAFMAVSALVVAVLLGKGWTIPAVLLTVAIVNFFVALYICKLLPRDVVLYPVSAPSSAFFTGSKSRAGRTTRRPAKKLSLLRTTLRFWTARCWRPTCRMNRALRSTPLRPSGPG